MGLLVARKGSLALRLRKGLGRVKREASTLSLCFLLHSQAIFTSMFALKVPNSQAELCRTRKKRDYFFLNCLNRGCLFLDCFALLLYSRYIMSSAPDMDAMEPCRRETSEFWNDHRMLISKSTKIFQKYKEPVMADSSPLSKPLSYLRPKSAIFLLSRSSLKPLISLDLVSTKLFCFRAGVHCYYCLCIIFSTNPARCSKELCGDPKFPYPTCDLTKNIKPYLWPFL